MEVKDGDPRARSLFERHDTWRRLPRGRRRTLCVGPGEKMVLLTVTCDALFVWRTFRSMDGQTGVYCAAFRNESSVRSSVLVREACELARRRWPGERLYTYVNTGKTAVSTRAAASRPQGGKCAGGLG